MNEDIAIKIEDVKFILYFSALIFSIYRHRAITSTVVCIILLLVFDYLFMSIRGPLKNLVNHFYFNDNSDFAIFLWYGVWVTLDTLFIYLLYQIHVWLNKSTTFFSHVVRYSYVGLIVVQIIGYLDDKFIDSDLLTQFYTYAIPIINVTLFIFIFIWLTFIEKPHIEKSNVRR